MGNGIDSTSFSSCSTTGRILNRFSKDIGQLDSMLPITFVDFSQVSEFIALGGNIYVFWQAERFPNPVSINLFFSCLLGGVSHFPQLILQNIGVVAVAAAVMPWILIPVVPLLIIFLFLRRYFLQTSRDVKRLESTSE